MASTSDLKEQIVSLENTAEITQTMQMISASKMQKAQDRVTESLPYIEALYEMLQKLGETDYTSPYLEIRDEVKNVAILVIGTSRGFVGNMISGLINETHQVIQNISEKYPKAIIHGLSLHKTAQKILHANGIKNSHHFSDYIDKPTTTELTTVYKLIMEKYRNSEFDQVYLIYTGFVNTFTQIARSQKILPLDLKEILKEMKKKEEEQEQQSKKQYIFEPNQKGILDKILPEYFESKIYTALLESIASEHSARMIAMQNATENCKEMINSVTLEYNRKRQSEITQQIIEVVNGSRK